MMFFNEVLKTDYPLGNRENEYLENRSPDSEKRREKRLDFIRPIAYFYQDTKRFFDGTILNHSKSGICLQTAFPIKSLDEICITTRREETGLLHNKTGESRFARVVWCEMRAGAYRIGIEWVSSSMHMNMAQSEINISSTREAKC